MDEALGHLDLERGDAYGRSFGDVYDLWYDGVTDAEATASFVVTRHPGGPILELGIGTGRLARPLAARGLTVVGLDASVEMLRRGRPNQGRPSSHADADPHADADADADADAGDRAGGAIHPIQADMRAMPFADRRSFGSSLIAFNTLFNLAEAAQQTALLAALGRLVDPRGTVIVEMLDVSALLDGPDRSIGLRRISDDPGTDPLIVTATQLDREGQRLRGQHLELTDDGISVRPWLLRWVTPDQLDTMADRAGLDLRERVGSWDDAPATDDGTTVISVYRPRTSA